MDTTDWLTKTFTKLTARLHSMLETYIVESQETNTY